MMRDLVSNDLVENKDDINYHRSFRTTNVNMNSLDFKLFCNCIYLYMQSEQNQVGVIDFFNKVVTHMNASILLKHKQLNCVREERSKEIFNKFIAYVKRYCPTEQCVGFYADKLCLTPKYLSKTIKDISGKTAGSWIDEFVLLEAKILLEHTNLTIQEVSVRMNFADQSSFGKFFKKKVGLSPKLYARKLINNQCENRVFVH